jgi:thioredoxin 1
MWFLLHDSLDIADSSPKLGPFSSSRPPRLLALGADKCVSCQAMAPVLTELQKEYAGRMKVEVINVWGGSEEAERYAVHWIPAQIFFDNTGRELYRHRGYYSKSEILDRWRELGYRFDQKEDLGAAP